MRFSHFTKRIKLALIFLLFLPCLLFADYQIKSDDIRVKTTDFSGNLSSADNTVQKALDTIDGLSISSISYPGAGIPLSTGSAWGTSITNNSVNWNTAYSWGNHASAGYESTSNKVTSLSGSSTDTQYPSAKLVYDQLAGKQPTGEYLTGVTVDSPLSGAGTAASHLTVDLSSKQAASAALTSIAGLTWVSGSPLVKMTAAGTFGLDSTAYLTDYTIDGAHMDALFSGASGLLKKTGTATYTLDTNSYLTSLSGAVLTDQTTGQTIGDTDYRLTKLWATDITCTNAISGSVTGNAGTVTNATLTTALTNNGGAGTLTWPAAGATLTIPTGGGTLGSAAFTSSGDYLAVGATAADSAKLNGQSASYYQTALGYTPLNATGATTGATSQAQTFTNGIVANTITGGADTTSDLYLKTTSGVGTTGADIHFLVGNNGGTEAMTVLNSGNVGIGVTSPTAALDVATGVTASSGVGYGIRGAQTLTAAANNDVLEGLRINTTFSDGAYTGVTHNILDLLNAGVSKFSVDDLGNVAASGTITSTFSGNLTGDVTGNVSGSSGSCTGNAATVTNGVYTTDIGSTVQAYDADLTTWAGITPGANVGTFLATPSSANLSTAVTDETGSGALVFGTSPVFTTQITSPKIYNAGDMTIDAYNAASDSTVTITNSDGTYDANLSIDGDLTVKNILVQDGGVLQLGYDTVDGELRIYSEQGVTDYIAHLFANTAMTSAANFYLPADEPASTQFLTMTSGGAIGFDTLGFGALSDPDANTILGWDDTDGAMKTMTIGTGLAYDHATHTISSTAGATALDDIADPDAATSISTDDGENLTFLTAVDGENFLAIHQTAASVTATTYLLDLGYNADADTEADFILCRDDLDGTPAEMFKVEYNGDTTTAGNINAAALYTSSLNNGTSSNDITIDASGDDIWVVGGTNLQMGNATTNSGAIYLRNGALGGDPMVTMQMSTNDFAVTTDTGDINLVPTGGEVNVTGAVVVDAAGVKISSDGDGALTLLGLGDGYDEDLTLNLDDTENTAVISSSTGVTKIDAGNIIFEGKFDSSDGTAGASATTGGLTFKDGLYTSGTATEYATKALDNLTSVAINTSLVSDTDNTDDLGSSSKAWKDVYAKGNIGVSGAVIVNGVIATTQSAGDNSTKVATTAYVDSGLAGRVPPSAFPGLYNRDRADKWALKTPYSTVANRYTILTPTALSIYINGNIYYITSQTEIDVSNAANWDTTSPTNYTTAANRAGKDFYIYACVPVSGTAPKILLSASTTYPSGYNTSTSRKIGGFHGLCVAVGTISGHTLTDFVAGDVLPASIWDLNHRPVSAPEGMVYSEGINKWVDIYLASGTGSSTASVYGASITDTRDWNDFVDDGGAVKKKMLTDPEFQIIAAGSNEGTNITGSADPGTTGGHIDSAGRRMISNIGVEDACGVEWQWLDEQTMAYSVEVTAGWYDLPGDKGYLYRPIYSSDCKLRAGGSWAESVYCGSRSRNAGNYRWYTHTTIGCRFCAEPV